MLSPFNMTLLVQHYQRSCREDWFTRYGYAHYLTMALQRDATKGES